MKQRMLQKYIKTLAMFCVIVTPMVHGEEFSWQLPQNTPLTINMSVGTLRVITRDDSKNEVSLDLENVDVVRDVSQPSLKVTGEAPIMKPQWASGKEKSTLTLPAPADIDFEKVTGVNGILRLPVGGNYVINGTRSNIALDKTEAFLITINVVNGNVTATNTAGGNIFIDVLNGDITTEAAASNLSLSVKRGNITDKNSTGDLAIQLVNGNLNLDTAAKNIAIHQITGKQTIAALQCVDFTDDLQTGSSSIAYGPVLKMGSVETTTAESTITIDKQWQGLIEAESKTDSTLTNQISEQKPAVIDALLPEARLEIKKGSANSSLKIKTVSGKVVLQ